jgi:hypothetical protein
MQGPPSSYPIEYIVLAATGPKDLPRPQESTDELRHDSGESSAYPSNSMAFGRSVASSQGHRGNRRCASILAVELLLQIVLREMLAKLPRPLSDKAEEKRA